MSEALFRRSAPFSASESAILVDILDHHLEAIESKRRDHGSLARKLQAWEDVLSAFNNNPAVTKLWVQAAGSLDTTRAVWTPAQVTVEAGTDFRILLEGQATNGGFAVDDLTFSLGSCTTRPETADPKLQEKEEG